MLAKIFQMFSLNGMGQVLYGLSCLFIVNFISVENYGISACILAFTNFCAAIVTAQYDIPIVYEKDENKRNACILTCCFLIPLLSFFCCCGGWCLQRYLFKGISINFFLISVFFVLIFNNSFFELVVRKNYIHKGNFKTLSYLLFFNYFLRSFFPFLLLLFWKDWRCSLFGETIATSIFGFIFTWKTFKSFIKDLDFKIIRKTLKEYKYYPLYQLPSTFFNNISFSSIIPALNFLYGNTVSGQFSFIYRILLVPLSFLGRIIGDFYQHSVSIAIQCKKLLKTLLKYSKILFLCSIITYILVFLIAFIFYKLGIKMEQYFYLWPIIPLALVQFMVNPLSSVLLINAKGIKYKIFYDFFIFFFILSVFFFSYWKNLNYYACIKLLTCVLALGYVFYYLLIFLYVRNFQYTDN